MKVLVTSSRTKKRWRCKLDCSVYPQNAGDHLIRIISIIYILRKYTLSCMYVL